MTFALSLDGHDVTVVDGRFALVTGPEAIAQRIRHTLRFFLGEYFLDIRLGTPYFEEFFGKGKDRGRMRAVIRQRIAGVKGVIDVPRITLELDRATRNIAIQWEARIQSGAVIDGTVLV